MRRLLTLAAVLALVVLAVLAVLDHQVDTAPVPSLPAAPVVVGAYAVPTGDLIVWSDGTARYVPVPEDSPRWDCRVMGNQTCGEGNGQGVPAGYYGPAR